MPPPEHHHPKEGPDWGSLPPSVLPQLLRVFQAELERSHRSLRNTKETDEMIRVQGKAQLLHGYILGITNTSAPAKETANATRDSRTGY